MKKLWLWENFVDGRPEYWAFDNPFPIHLDNGDPQTLGEPCGYALLKPSRNGQPEVGDAEVLRAIAQASEVPKSGGGISPDTAELVLTTMRNVADYLEANMDSAPEDDEYDWLRTPIMALRTAIARFEPPKSELSDAKDAARWRYVRDFIGPEDILYWEREEQAGARADAEISAETDAETDAAILRREGHKPGGDSEAARIARFQAALDEEIDP